MRVQLDPAAAVRVVVGDIVDTNLGPDRDLGARPGGQPRRRPVRPAVPDHQRGAGRRGGGIPHRLAVLICSTGPVPVKSCRSGARTAAARASPRPAGRSARAHRPPPDPRGTPSRTARQASAVPVRPRPPPHATSTRPAPRAVQDFEQHRPEAGRVARQPEVRPAAPTGSPSRSRAAPRRAGRPRRSADARTASGAGVLARAPEDRTATRARRGRPAPSPRSASRLPERAPARRVCRLALACRATPACVPDADARVPGLARPGRRRHARAGPAMAVSQSATACAPGSGCPSTRSPR